VATGQTIFPKADIRVDSALVLVPAQVTNVLGSPVTDLHKEDFKVFEDGVEQTITNFSLDDALVDWPLIRQQRQHAKQNQEGY
jgi:hypothetical protein